MLENFNSLLKDFDGKLDKALDRLAYEYTIIRAGRANPKILDRVLVNYYGTPTPIPQMANLSVPEARMIVISPWDITQIKEINKAILASDLGVTPTDDGHIIRLVFPALTEERRKELAKEVKKLAEECRIAVRNERRDMLETLKAEKNKNLSEDEFSSCEEEVQKVVNKYNKMIDDMCENKEKEVLEV